MLEEKFPDSYIIKKRNHASLVNVQFGKYPYSPSEGIGISWVVGGLLRPKKVKKCMKLNWNLKRGGGS